MEQDLAKELLEMFTARKMGKAFFTNSGSEANDTQVYLLISSISLLLLWTSSPSGETVEFMLLVQTKGRRTIKFHDFFI